MTDPSGRGGWSTPCRSASPAYAGMDIGRDNGGVVDLSYEDQKPFAFTGTVKTVTFDIKPHLTDQDAIDLRVAAHHGEAARTRCRGERNEGERQVATGPTGEDSPTQFVRYAPELDAVSGDFEEDLKSVVAGVEQYVVNSVAGEGVGRAVRFAHAKGYGVVRAEVEILDGLPPAYAQGIYATPGRHDALIRFSNGVAHLGADVTLSNAHGLALQDV